MDKFGAVNIIFYDDRNTATDSAAVFLARSADGGEAWAEYEISDHNFKPVPIGGLGQGYQGDNIDITSTDTRLWPVWMDNSSGIYQIWTCPVDFSSLYGIHDIGSANSSSFIKQISPNPFKTYTRIIYHVKSNALVNISFYDINGEKISEILNEVKNPGDYETVFPPPGLRNVKLKSGIYFCHITMKGQIEIRKLIYLE